MTRWLLLWVHFAFDEFYFLEVFVFIWEVQCFNGFVDGIRIIRIQVDGVLML